MATSMPAPTENPTPVKNTETGDYMLTFLDPATNHMQFTLELSLLKADGSPVIGPLTQKNGIFNLGKLENGEYQWALSRVNTKVNRKTSTRNGNFTISDSKAELKKLDYEIEIEKRELELAEIRRKKMMLQTSSVKPSTEGGEDEQKSKVERSSTTNITYNIHDSAISGDIETKIKDKDE